jgi:hypothetical protein
MEKNFMNKTAKNFTGVVLAADRGPGDPLAQTAGAPCKSLVSLGGRPMVLRVLDTLAGSREVDSLAVCGPSEALLAQETELLSRINAGKIRWVPPQATPSASAYHVLERLSSDVPVLVTTADHAFLTAEIVDFFCGKARASGCDVVVALAPYEEVMRAFPRTRRTATRLRDGAFCSCNLFAFLTPRAKNAAEFWRKCERNRKKPWRMMRVIGWQVVARYLLGTLSMEEGLRRLSARMNVKAGVIIMPFPEAAVDVDTVSDWRLAEEVLARRG